MPIVQSDPPASYNIMARTPPDIRRGTVENPVMSAVRIPEVDFIQLDGYLDEEIWQRAPVATAFTQRSPHDGRSASEHTEARIVYTDDAIYVGIMAYDSAPDSIIAPLFRRDGGQPSDWVYVGFDSYNDSRTGFLFGVNPRGVQRDILYYNDSQADLQWDAVWEARTRILDNGWSAEIRIPISQLRFSGAGGHQSWGVNFQRTVARRGEISFWAPTPLSENRMVSRFGRLDGITGLSEPLRLEIMPYTAGSLVRAPDPGTGNPYFNSNQFRGSLGGDVRYGLTSNMTLTATFNPDFGQVEADPSEINLTANESFFSEQRPFFQEGSDIFRFGTTRAFIRQGSPSTFYSRRIGRSPQGSPAMAGQNARFVDQPDQTTIASALKLSGKTESGWSIGALNAFTLQEKAQFRTMEGDDGRIAVEPVTNYLVTRVKKDFNAGNTYAGGFFSAVNRRIGDTYFAGFLRSSAYLGGVDFEHNFNNRNWVASGAFSYSVINGSVDAIGRAQRSPVRYFNRVDSRRQNLDPDRTSLSGYATEISLMRQGGSKWLGSVTYTDVSPGYEVNDLGFQNRADMRGLTGGMVFRNTRMDRFQFFEQSVMTVQGWNYDGDKIFNGLRTRGNLRFNNQWSVNYTMNANARLYSDRLTRGGPVMQQPANMMFDLFISTNPNRMVSMYSGLFYVTDESGGFIYDYLGGATVRPSTWLQVSVQPGFIHNRYTSQYIRTVTDEIAVRTYGRRYIFSDIDQTTLYANLRLNWTFSPTVSLQTYVRPFISSGRFSGFKELAAPRTRDFERYGEDRGDITHADGMYIVDPGQPGGAGFSFGNPDFNYRSVQGNAVFRWEYSPGSTLFVVWQQQRDDVAGMGDFNIGRDLSGLFRAKPVNVFLVKVAYWFG